METGPGFHEDHVLSDGTRVTLRHVHPEDAPELKRGLERLTPQSRYRRFLGAVTTLTDEQLRYLTCVDGRDHVAIVAVARGPDGSESGLGIARFIRQKDDPSAAEAAITVIDDAQGKGIGRLLALALARAAYERDVRRFRGQILADNVAVRQLLTDVGAVITQSKDAATGFEVELTPTPFTPGSQLDLIARRLLRAAARTTELFSRGGNPA